jgi:hypothetical protein
MIGAPNQISKEEILQRTEIRFYTQKGYNDLHPLEGFDFLVLTTISKKYGNLRLTPEILLRQELMDAISQDSDINFETVQIEIKDIGDRTYEVILRYEVKGNTGKSLEFRSTIGAF